MTVTTGKKKLVYREAKGTFYAVQWLRANVSNLAASALRRSMKELTLHPIEKVDPKHRDKVVVDDDVTGILGAKFVKDHPTNPGVMKLRPNEGS